MCSPGLMLAVQGVGTLVAAKGAQSEGQAQSAYYNYLAAQNEAQVPGVTKAADVNVGNVVGSEMRQEQNLDRSVATTVGTQKSGMAANGVWGGSATAGNVVNDTMNKAALDRAAIRTNANLQSSAIATGATNQVNALRSQEGAFLIAGQNAQTAGNINAGSALLNGASQVASNWYKWNLTKPTGNGDPLANVYGGV